MYLKRAYILGVYLKRACISEESIHIRSRKREGSEESIHIRCVLSVIQVCTICNTEKDLKRAYILGVYYL